MTGLPTIVIPYFKPQYLEAVLESLAAQTRGGFQVFVGDDASPHDPSAILRKFQGRLDLVYHRFAENLGGSSLAQHWSRCVRRTDSEWVWLFSDDDLASPDCMEAFCAALAETNGKYDVYRFNTAMIDGQGAIFYRPPVTPPTETPAGCALAKAVENRNTFAVEYIFRRSAFEAAGGFLDFPMAWFSDDASWIAFARRTGFKTMAKGEVFWRQSGLNLSTPKPERMAMKLQAFRLYLLWLEKEFPDPGFQRRLRAAFRGWLPYQIKNWGGEPRFWDGLKFWLFFIRFTGHWNFFLLRTFWGMTGLKSRLRGLTGFGERAVAK